MVELVCKKNGFDKEDDEFDLATWWLMLVFVVEWLVLDAISCTQLELQVKLWLRMCVWVFGEDGMSF